MTILSDRLAKARPSFIHWWPKLGRMCLMNGYDGLEASNVKAVQWEALAGTYYPYFAAWNSQGLAGTLAYKDMRIRYGNY